MTENAVVDQLVAMFGPSAAEPEALHIRDWRAESHTSPAGVERLTAYEWFGDRRYAGPALGGRLHWSSTETSPDFPGHIEGALVAAQRAARAVISATDRDPLAGQTATGTPTASSSPTRRPTTGDTP